MNLTAENKTEILSPIEKTKPHQEMDEPRQWEETSPEHFGIHLQKEYLKFSAAHFLIFPDGTSERLHGHNYQVEVEIEGHLMRGSLVYDFLDIKPLVKQICDELDEHVLLPGNHPHIQWHKQDALIHVAYKQKKYMFPENEVLILPIDNSSTERFAYYILHRLHDKINEVFSFTHITQLKVIVHESPGQSGYYWKKFT